MAGRLVGLLAVVVATVALGWTSPVAAQGCASHPPVSTFPGECDEVTTTTPSDSTPDDTEPDPTTTTESSTTTEATTTTAAPTTTASTTTAPPTTMPTTAPPEAEPQASTTTAVVEQFVRVTQETPSLSGVVALFAVGVVGAGAVLGVGYVNTRR